MALFISLYIALSRKNFKQWQSIDLQINQISAFCSKFLGDKIFDLRFKIAYLIEG